MHRNWQILACVALILSLGCESHGGGAYSGIARAHRDVELGFTVSGRVAGVLVREGERVNAGQPLLMLDERDAREQLELLQLRSRSMVEIESARASLDLAETEEAQARAAQDQGGASRFEVRRAELATTQARLTLERRERELMEQVIAVERAKLAVQEFTCSSTVSGVVEDVRVEEGELVERLIPVIRVVDSSVLRIDVPVPTGESLAMAEGDSVRVRAMLGDQTIEMEGEIAALAAVADSASETRLVTIRAVNPEGVPAGIRVRVLIGEESAERP